MQKGLVLNQLQQLSYERPNVDSTKTAGSSCNKSYSEADFTNMYIWEPDSASHMEEKSRGKQQECS